MNTIEKLEARREGLLKEAETIATVIGYLKREEGGAIEKPKRPCGKVVHYKRNELTMIKARFYELMAEGKWPHEADEIIGKETGRTDLAIQQCRSKRGWLAKKVKK